MELYQIRPPLENKGGEAVKYTKVVHFSELMLLRAANQRGFQDSEGFRASTLLFFLKKKGVFRIYISLKLIRSFCFVTNQRRILDDNATEKSEAQLLVVEIRRGVRC